MTRRKVKQEAKLSYKITIRLAEPFFKKLEAQQLESNCRTMAEFVRMMVLKEEIIWLHKDATLDATAAELAGIRKELTAITISINSVTRSFNGAATDQKKIIDSLHILEDYRKVGKKVEIILQIISDLSVKWSHE